MRPTRHQRFMEYAFSTAKSATCMRLSVGAIIVADRRVVSMGYNGVPPGEPHCRGNDCPGRFRCELTVHAEANALRRLHGVSITERLDMYCTDSPCIQCAALMLSGGVRRLFFAYPYRDAQPIEFLVESGIEVYRINLAGYVIRMPDMELVEPWD